MALNIAVDIQNGRKRFLQTIALTTTPSLTAFSATTQDGVSVGSGCTLCFQPDADVYMLVRPASASGTQPITATNSLRVPQFGQEYQKLSQSIVVGSDGKVEAMAASGTANLQVFLIDPS